MLTSALALLHIPHRLRWCRTLALLALLVATSCTSQSDPNPSALAKEQAKPTAQAQRPTENSIAPQPGVVPETSAPSNASPMPKPSPTPSLTPTATLTPSPSPSPTPTTTPSPTPTPTPMLRRLTTGGCCTQPFWSPDSQQVLFIDKPAPDASVGIWGVALDSNPPTPRLFTRRIALYTSDFAYLIEPVQGRTFVERLPNPGAEEGERWTVPADGRPVTLSPGRTRIVWEVSNDDVPVERRTTQVWTANLDGTDPQLVATLARGGISGWLSDDLLLLVGRESLQSRETIVYTLSLEDGSTLELIRADRPRGLSLSPDGRWLAYFISFSDDPVDNGQWLVRTDGSERLHLDGELFGAYQWRDARRLAIIPFRPEAEYHELWQFDVETGKASRLTDPDVTPFKIANGDWVISPDGRHVAFVESSDRNIWVLTLLE